MQKIHISRDRQSLGQFPADVVAEGLQSGRFFPTDLAWREGMETWQPLSTFTDLPAVEDTEFGVPPLPGLGAEVPETHGGMVAGGVTPAWEGGTGSGGQRLVETIREVLSSPVRAFAGLKTDGSLMPPLAFNVLLGSLTGIISLIYSFIFEKVDPNGFAEFAEFGGEAVATWFYVGFMIGMPVLVLIGSFLSAASFHLSLMLIGAAKAPFAATFRVLCYSQGATSVFLLIPMCGSLVQMVWNLYAVVVGLKLVHRMTTGQAVVAVVIPVLLCCGLMIAGYSLLIGTAVATGAMGASLGGQ